MDRSLISFNNPQAPESEAYRMLRTNIGYTGVDKKHKVILVTSSKMSEGKSTVAANLAISMAQSKHKVILMDCDLRRPRVHKLFATDNSKGLSDVLTKDMPFKNVVFHSSQVEGLDIMSSGVIPPMPSELLDSKKMEHLVNEFRDVYDYVILDSPPVLSVTDATILSKIVDGVILTVAANETPIDAVVAAKRSLDKVNAHVIGSVLTKADIGRRGQYYYNYEYADKRSKKASKPAVSK